MARTDLLILSVTGVDDLRIKLAEWLLLDNLKHSSFGQMLKAAVTCVNEKKP